jgi:AAA+ ATPase superfamily predicted ATPase
MNKEIIGRSEEKQKLSDMLLSHRSELVAVYGRRRIGKTYLIREFFKDKIIFSFTGLCNENKNKQLKNFVIKLNDFSGIKTHDPNPNDWLDAFNLLKIHLKTIKETKKKKVIFIDEFPWIDSQKSGFLSAFENFWNDYCATRTDLIVVICGSAASYMVKKIIRNVHGLSKRITQTIKLMPFTLQETKAFLHYKGVKMEEYELLKLYMSIGGIAEYLEHIKPGESAVTTIDRLCFQPGAYLENEYDDVFKSLFDEHSYHQKIMNALANNKKEGITRNELMNELSIGSSGKFSNSLEDLLQSGFILKYEAYKNSKKATLYRIYDEFCLFHLQFVQKHKGASWTTLFQQQAYITWCGYVFETICLKHIQQLKKALKCDQIASVNYQWRNENAQIDLVIDRNDGVVTLCEIKFYNDELTLDETTLNQLRKKENEFRVATNTRKSIYTCLISTFGAKSNQYSNAILSNNVTMKALF